MKRVAILGVPRSGTSWVSQLFNSHPLVRLRFQPLFSYRHKGRLAPNADKAAIDDFFDEINGSTDSFALMQSEFHNDYPQFAKAENPSHLILKETRYLYLVNNFLRYTDDVKVVGILRNPLAVLTSWILAPKEFSPQWDIRTEWLYAQQKNLGRAEEYYGFERWRQIAETFLALAEQFPQRLFILKYGELIKAPQQYTEALFSWAGLSLHPQTIDFINRSSSSYSENPYSVFRAKQEDNSWKTYLPNEIAIQVREQLYNTPLASLID
jgi:hypothetical protein